jgi:glycosyltransferase involved in cell wall biosynthesis
VTILHLEDEPWDSGIAQYALTLAGEQARRGETVEFWGAARSPVLEAAKAAGLKTRAWTPGPLGWPEIPALKREAKALSPAVIDAHTGSAHAVALMIAPRGAAVVRTRADARLPTGTSLTRWAAGRTAAFIAANSELQVALERAFPQARVRRVLQGIEGPEDAAPAPGAPIVGILARMDPVKGHEVLLEAVQALKPRVPDLRALCAGEGKLLGRLQWQLGPLKLERSVRFLGRVEDKWSFLAGCRVGVAPSLGSEAVSRAVLEWMAAGRAVVASRVGGIPDLVDDGVTGLLVPPGDAAALAGALESLLAAPERAEEMGRAARVRWEELFSPGTFYRATKAVYDEAIHPLPR